MYDSKQQTYTKTEYDIVRAENEDLCDNIDAVRQERADYLNGTREGKLQDENKALREALGGSSRIVEKYKDACMEWAKEAQHKGLRQVKEFWERRAKSMANLLIMNQEALKSDKESDHEVGL